MMVKKTCRGTAFSEGPPKEEGDGKDLSFSTHYASFMIDLSKVLEQALTGRKLIDPQPERRAEKLVALKKQIDSGTYQINCDNIAAGVLHALMGEDHAPGIDWKVAPVLDAISLS